MEESDLPENPSSEIYETVDELTWRNGTGAAAELPFHIPRD